MGSEPEKMKYANKIKNLVCHFIRLDFDESLQSDMLVMEPIYPVDYRAYEIEKRELWVDVFFDEMKQLHRAGFVHRHIRCLQKLAEKHLIMCFLPTTASGLLMWAFLQYVFRISFIYFALFY